jgi:Ino eighty subunit 2
VAAKRASRSSRIVREVDSEDDEDEDEDEDEAEEVDAMDVDDDEEEEDEPDAEGEEDDDMDAEGDEDDDIEDSPQSRIIVSTKQTIPVTKPTITINKPQDSVEAKEMAMDDDELSDPDSELDEEDAEGEDEDAEGEEDDELIAANDDDEEMDSDEDLSRGQTPDVSKMTKRQRALVEEGSDGGLMALSNEAQKKKHLTAEEHAMRRAEMARRRKNLSEKRNEEEKVCPNCALSSNTFPRLTLPARYHQSSPQETTPKTRTPSPHARSRRIWPRRRGRARARESAIRTLYTECARHATWCAG